MGVDNFQKILVKKIPIKYEKQVTMFLLKHCRKYQDWILLSLDPDGANIDIYALNDEDFPHADMYVRKVVKAF